MRAQKRNLKGTLLGALSDDVSEQCLKMIWEDKFNVLLIGHGDESGVGIGGPTPMESVLVNVLD